MANNTNPVVWFEIPAKDIMRAKKFYEGAFNFTMTLNEMGSMKMAWFPWIDKAPGTTGSLVESAGYQPSHAGTTIYFSVSDIDAALVKIEQSGGKTLNKKTNIGQYGFIAHFEDTEGNRLALHAMN